MKTMPWLHHPCRASGCIHMGACVYVCACVHVRTCPGPACCGHCTNVRLCARVNVQSLLRCCALVHLTCTALPMLRAWPAAAAAVMHVRMRTCMYLRTQSMPPIVAHKRVCGLSCMHARKHSCIL